MEAADPFAVFTAGERVGLRTFEIDAAVGLLKRSAAVPLKVALLAGVGNGGAALRALARDAAVGANRPDEGVLGRGAPLDGVLERAMGVELDEGVFGRLGVALDDDLAYLLLGGVDMMEVDLVDVPVCWGLRGWDLGGLRTDDVWGGGRTDGFCGVLVAADALGAGPLELVEVAFRTGGDLVYVADDLGVFAGSSAGGDTTTSAAAGGLAGDNGVASMTDGDLDCDAGRARIEDVVDILGISVDFGGHSLFCRISSLAESPVVCDATLMLRGNPGGN